MECGTRFATRCVAFLLRSSFFTNACSKVVELLNQRKIKVSSVDFIRFTWLNKKMDQKIEEEDDDDAKEEEDVTFDDIPLIQPVKNGEHHYTNPTIWIGILPKTLTGAVTHESSKDIRAFLDSLQVQNINIAYRELEHYSVECT